MAAFFMDLEHTILTRQDAAFKHLATKRDLWDDVESLFHNQLNDFVSSATTKSQVFDPKLTTLTLERGYRVMAQLPTGKVKPISVNDIGASQLMNLLLEKYVMPNANSQFDFLTKLRMADIYSNVYGNFFAMVDWDIRSGGDGDGYVGPDLWLLNIRDVFHQVGAVSQSDAISKREEDQYPDAVAAKEAGYFEVFTMFEKDRWVDLCVDAHEIFREIKNPHENDELPVVCKYSIPLLDDFMGMGDFERGKTMQMTVNSIWNLYLDAVKMSIFPPALINKDNIAAMSSIKWGAAEKWLVRGQINNAAQVLNLSPQGISTFNNTYQIASAALLNMFGTTDTTVTQQTEAGYGKTPQALQMQQIRENTRDNADRFYMEQFVSKVVKKMVNLMSRKQSKAITVRLFEEDLKQLERSYPEIKEDYDERTGKLSIAKKKTGSILYDYEIVSGSTFAVDQKTQQQSLAMLLQLFMSSQRPDGGNTLIERLEQDGYTVKMGELFKRIVSNSGIQDWDKILEEMTDEEQGEAILKQHAQEFMQVVAQTQAQQNLNQVPPEQAGPPMAGAGYGG